GPDAFSAANPATLAKKALTTAKKADRRARQAGKKADQAIATLNRTKGFLAADVRTVSSPAVSIAQGATQIVSASCPPGTIVVSGGFAMIGPDANVFSDRRSGNGWSVGGDNTASTTGPATLTVDAQCAATGNAVASRHRDESDRERDRRLLEQQQA